MNNFYGLESVAINEHASGVITAIAAPTVGRIVLDYFMVSVGTTGTVKFSSATGGTSDTDLFTLHMLGNTPAIMSDIKTKLNFGESLELTASQTFSALIGYHVEGN